MTDGPKREQDAQKFSIYNESSRLDSEVLVMYHFPGVEYDIIHRESIAYMKKRRWIKSTYDLSKDAI